MSTAGLLAVQRKDVEFDGIHDSPTHALLRFSSMLHSVALEQVPNKEFRSASAGNAASAETFS